MKEEIIVISLGGSLIIPDQIDVEFLREFKKVILDHVEKGKKFIIVTGGGRFCRRYQEALKSLANTSIEDLDWLGIFSTRFNAEFLRLVFEEFAYSEIVTDPTIGISLDRPLIMIGAGWKPGWSTDYDSVILAKSVGAKKIINLSNTDYLYDSDPQKNPNAQKIEKISWKEYRELIPKEWDPGLNSPFDPIASGLAEREGIEVTIMNGKPISNLENYLEGKKFLGTVIS